MYSVEELTGNELINDSNLGNGLFNDFEKDTLLDNFKKAIKDKGFKLFAFLVCDFTNDEYLMKEVKSKWNKLDIASGDNLAVVAFNKDYTEYSKRLHEDALKNEFDIKLNNPSILFFTLSEENDNLVIGYTIIFELRSITTVNIDDLASLFSDINMELDNIFLDKSKISSLEYNNRIEKLFNNSIFKKHKKLDVKISNFKFLKIAGLLISLKPFSLSSIIEDFIER